MRQLWLTGWCNNYARHVAASFLIGAMKVELHEIIKGIDCSNKTGYLELSHYVTAGGPLAESVSPTDGLTDGRTLSLIEMRRRIYKSFSNHTSHELPHGDTIEVGQKLIFSFNKIHNYNMRLAGAARRMGFIQGCGSG